MSGLEAAYEECQSITRREAKNFYYAFLTLPTQRRRAICVAYAFCRHCDDSVDGEGSVETKLARLVAIRGDLEKTYACTATAPATGCEGSSVRTVALYRMRSATFGVTPQKCS